MDERLAITLSLNVVVMNILHQDGGGPRREPLVHTLQQLQLELQTSEELLAESQRDNKDKTTAFERMKQYIKDLERLLEHTLGPRWRDEHGISRLVTSTTSLSASTPLPKPPTSFLRHSTSITFSNKRSSRQFRPISTADLGILERLRELPEATDDTPTGAMKRLQNSRRGREAPKGEASDFVTVPLDTSEAVTSPRSIDDHSKKFALAAMMSNTLAGHRSILSKAVETHDGQGSALQAFLCESEYRLQRKLDLLKATAEIAHCESHKLDMLGK